MPTDSLPPLQADWVNLFNQTNRLLRAHIELKHLLGRPLTITLLTDQRDAGIVGGHWLESNNQHRTFGGLIPR